MRHPIRLLLPLAALLLAAPARAADPPLPPLRPGLWVQSIGLGGRPMEVRACIDAQTLRRMWDRGLMMGTQDCARRDVARTATGYTLDLMCRIADRTMTGHGVITATGDTDFHMDLHSRIDPPFPAMPGEQSVAMDGRWSGPCPADMRPGDMVMPGGLRMNVDRMPQR
jgi:hypothetical protein